MSGIVTTYKLEENEELQLRIDPGETVVITNTTMNDKSIPNFEVFGSELSNSLSFSFSGVSVYSWFGGLLEVKGNVAHHYQSKESMVKTYASVHQVLQTSRLLAHENHTSGPRILIAGKKYTGKTMLCKTLLGYAVREEETPIYVDFDLSRGRLSVPGTMSAALIDKHHRFCAENTLEQLNALSLFYGFETPSENVNRFRMLVEDLATSVDQLCQNKPEVHESGLVVNCGNWVDKSDAYPFLDHIIEKLHINYILVFEMPSLYDALKTKYQDIHIQSLRANLGTNLGVTEEELPIEAEWNVKRYFEGTYSEKVYLPSTLRVSFSSLSLYQFPDKKKCIEQERLGYNYGQETPYQLQPQTLQRGTILAITDAKSESDILHCSIFGYVVVIAVDEKSNELELRVPQSGGLPNTYLIAGHITTSYK